MLSRIAVVMVVSALAACSGSDAPPAATADPSRLARVEAWLDPGEQLALAAALTATDPMRPNGPGAAAPPLAVSFRQRLVATADGVVRSLALESGAGIDGVWSPMIDAMAEQESAPADANDNGTNADETLAELRDQYVFRSNAELPDGVGSSFALPTTVPSRLARKPSGRDDYAGLRLEDSGRKLLEMRAGDLGDFILATTRRATRLLSQGRGDLYGEKPEDGMLGLLLLEVSLGAERLLLEQLAYDGKVLGAFGDPEKYDPTSAPKLFPAHVGYQLGSPQNGLPAKPDVYLFSDRGASLLDHARLLRGFAELAWIGSENQTNPLLRRLLAGDPFGSRPELASQSAPPPGNPNPANETISWDKHIKGLLAGTCSACHGAQQFQGDFQVLTYDLVLRGGAHRETNPTVVKGKSRESLLWQILALDPPPVSRRMPDFGPFWGPTRTQLIADWIDGGAVEKDPGADPVPEPRPGLDGIRVIVKNLETLFRDPSGALVDRVDLDGRGQAVLADSAGEILQGVAAAYEAVPNLPKLAALLQGHAELVASKLIAADGRVWESYALDTNTRSSAPADFGAAASVVAGLFEARRVLDLQSLHEPARRAAIRLVEDFVDELGRPRLYPGIESTRVTPRALARLLEAMSAWAASDSDPRPAAVYTRVYELLESSGLVLAEWPATGELFGDSNIDSDNDGIVEVGTELLPPLFAGELRNEQARDGLGFPERPLHWSRDVLPALIQHCQVCHTGSARQGDFQLDTYSDLFRGGDFRNDMPSIVPGKPEESLLWLKVDRRSPPFGGQMPEGYPPLPQDVRARLKRWIEAGARRD